MDGPADGTGAVGEALVDGAALGRPEGAADGMLDTDGSLDGKSEGRKQFAPDSSSSIQLPFSPVIK